MKLLKTLDEKFEISICVFLMSLMTVLIFAQVIMRYVFHSSLSWSEELSRYVFIWLIYIGVSYGSKQMKHLKIEAGLSIFPSAVRPYIVIIGDILFLVFSIFIIFTSSIVVNKQMMLGQSSPALGIPMTIIYAAPAVGFFLTSIRQVQTIIYRVKSMRSGGDL